MIGESGFVLGVDVGWAKDAKTTGACVLEWTATVATVSPIRLSTADWNGLQRLLPGGPILALAVDGPLRGALDEIGVYRDAELMLTRRFAERIGKPGQSSSGNGKKLNAAVSPIHFIRGDLTKSGALDRFDSSSSSRASTSVPRVVIRSAIGSA